MYHTLTTEHSLFFLNEQYVEDFKQIAEEMTPLLSISKFSYFSLQDAWAEALNIWILLQREEKNIVEAFDKTLYYSADHIMINALKDNYYFNHFRAHPNVNCELIYILSILLANELNDWYYKLFSNYGLSDIIKRNHQRTYFTQHVENNQHLEVFIQDQARLVKVLVQELSYSKEFERLVKKCCDDAHFFYEDHFIKTRFTKLAPNNLY